MGRFCGLILLIAGVCVAAGGSVRASHAANPAYGPVCSNGQYLGDIGLSPQGQVYATRRIFYCPQGATVLQLLFAGGYAGGPTDQPPTEHNLVDPQIISLSVETYVPPVWDPTVSYAVGDQVTGPAASDNAGATYVAVKANVKNLPTRANTGVWKLTTATPVPITCNNARPCVLGTHTDGAGNTVTDGFLATDPLAVNIPPRTLIAIRMLVRQSGKQVLANGASQTARGASYMASGASEPDLTLSGSVVPNGPSHNIGPFALVGLQNVDVPVPSVCIIGDSRAGGVSGVGVTYVTVANGGSGYVPRDVGRLVVNADVGGTPDSRLESAVYVIQAVSGGAVTRVGVYYPGHYAAPKTTTAAGVKSSPPIGVQTTRPLHTTTGSGLTVNIASNAMSAASGSYEDATTFAQGFVQKGLSDAAIPFASFSRQGDRAFTWASDGGDINRLAAIKLAGCTRAILQYGINDTHAGRTASQIEGDLVYVANQVLALGPVQKVYLATVHPQTNSTDYWATTAKQTPVPGYEPARRGLNTWERTVPAPFSGTFDTAEPVEVNAANVPTHNGGLWIVNGKTHYATPDSVHLSPTAAILSAAVITAHADILQ